MYDPFGEIVTMAPVGLIGIVMQIESGAQRVSNIVVDGHTISGDPPDRIFTKVVS